MRVAYHCVALLSAVFLSCSLHILPALHAADDKSVADVGAPPLPDGFRPQSFTLPQGFHAELAAGPPLVTHPTMGCFDEQGRLFVCNNAGVNMSAEELEQHLPNSINMLEDVDGDGVFDRSTVFADRMTFPMGGAWHDGALYVASPPCIWRLEDTDGDGVADRRDIIVNKFGYTGNAASIHGCFFRPDGRLYWCDGYHGHEFKDKDGNIVSQRKGSYIFSCWPDGSDVRIHCGGGMDNPVELDFTEEGDLIGTVNILYTRPRIDCLVHWQYGGAYPHREAVLEELTITGDLLGPIHRFGHVAVSGTTRYRSVGPDDRWKDNYFVTQFNLGKVVRVELERSGSTYQASQREFLSCGNRDFHPTDVIQDADGSLLVVDTGGWFYRGCPTSQISKPDILGGIYRIRPDAHASVSDPRGQQINWSERSDAQLMQDLGDSRFAVRDQAIYECAQRGHKMAQPLKQTMKSGNPFARRNAVWAMTRISTGLTQHQDHSDIQSPSSGTEDSVDSWQLWRPLIVDALADQDASVRQSACNALMTIRHQQSLELLMASLNDESPAVRRTAATALGSLRNKQAVPSLLNSLASEASDAQPPHHMDRELQHAILNALIEINEPQHTWQLLADLPKQQQLSALLAINEMDSHFLLTLPPGEVQVMLSEVDRESLPVTIQLWKRMTSRSENARGETAKIIVDAVSDALETELQALNELQNPESSSDGSVAVINEIISQMPAEPSVAEVIGKWLASSDLSPATEMQILNAVQASSGATVHESWVAPLTHRLSTEQGDRLVQLLQMLSGLRSHPFQSQIAELIEAADATDQVKLAACRAMLAANNRPSDRVMDLLVQMIQAGSPATSAEAAATLSSTSLSETQLQSVVQLLSSAGPQQLPDLVRLFKRSLKPELASEFLTGIENARSLSSLPRIEVSEVVKSFPVELHDRANALLDRMQMAEQQKLLKLDSLVSGLQSGNAARGQQVFFSEKAKCATCHVVGDKGKRVGPDLTTIGANRSAQDLLESIVFPSATIVRQYEPYTLVTTDGRTYSGLVIRDTSNAVTIQQSTGDPVTVSRSDMEELVPATVSIMPKGLDEALTPDQIADLVVWLQSLKSSDR
jgi:putative membrane-bound dehydrogenase-like protein